MNLDRNAAYIHIVYMRRSKKIKSQTKIVHLEMKWTDPNRTEQTKKYIFRSHNKMDVVITSSNQTVIRMELQILIHFGAGSNY